MDLIGQLEAQFSTKRVSIVDFAESPAFCNRRLYPRQRLLLKLIFLEDLTEAEEKILDYWIAGGRNGDEIVVCPQIRERIAWLKENGYKHFREVILVGGRRCSKGFLVGLAMAKLMYDALQIQDPARFWKIDADKEILYSVVAAAQDQAKDQQYADFASMVRSCDSMQPYIHKMQELEFSVMTESDKRKLQEEKRRGVKVQRDTSKLRGKALPANSRTIRGSTTMAIAFDEFAHFQQGENDQSDSEVYGSAIPALSQFGRDAMIFCSSSPYSKVGKFFQRYSEAMAINEETEEPQDPALFSIRLPSWALFEGWWDDPEYVAKDDTAKKCITVSPDWDAEKKNEDGSYFYSEDDRHQIRIERAEEASNPQSYKVEKRAFFAEVVDAYLNPDMVDRMFLGRPFETIDPEDNNAVKRLYKSFPTNWDQSTNRFIYRAHIDPSSTTAGFGFAMGHVEQFELQDQVENHVVFDVIKRWNPKDFPDSVIDWDPILAELMDYCRLFRPASLTFDQHQTLHPMQWMRKQLRHEGLETRVYEKVPNIQTNWNRAEVFRTGLYRDFIHAPLDIADCEYAGLELKYLQEIRTARVPRVEKQDVGPVQTKDIADAIMEVVEACIGNEIAIGERMELGASPLRYGAQGGWSIGKGMMGQSPRAAALSDLYTRRVGEQGLSPIAARGQGRMNPARRAVGGRPIPRNLPSRSWPTR